MSPAETETERFADATTAYAPLPVKGYQPQSPENVALVNEGKELEERVLRWLDRLSAPENTGVFNGLPPRVDPRFLALGRTNIQQGFMWAARSVFQPERVRLPEDEA